MLARTRDFLWALFFGVISVTIYIYSGTLVSNTKIPLIAESSLYTRIWAVVLLICSLALLVRSLVSGKDEKVPPLLTMGTIFTTAMLTLYLLFLKTAGFLLCTALFLTCLITYFHWLSLDTEEQKEINILFLAAKYGFFSLFVTFALNFAFSTLLNVSLPSGVLF